MKKLLFIFTLILGLNAISESSIANNRYKTDESEINTLFDNSSDVTFTSTLSNLLLPSITQAKDTENKQMVAGIIALVEFVTGVGILIPVHRLILGTGGQTFKIIGLYCITLGGCGFLSLIDGIMLLIDSEGSQYIENPKFLMWN